MSQKRTIIENISPSVEHGRHPAKRIVGDTVTVTADIYADGHDLIRAVVRYRPAGVKKLAESEMTPVGNDAWTADFVVDRLGSYEFQVEAWVDHFDTWTDGLSKKAEVESESDVDLAIGAKLLREAAERAGRGTGSRDRAFLEATAALLEDPSSPLLERTGRALDEKTIAVARRYPDRSLATRSEPLLSITVDPERARFSAWYEMFPRSLYSAKGDHGTFRDVIRHLDYVQSMGFDVLYLPPIHPIGTAYRKGRNNALVAEAGDPGSPWAIGSPEGGHTDIHPSLGTAEDFRALVAEAGKRGMQVALDIAFQCSPDHPWVKQHPEWFVQRPDGTIQYAENPPKKYHDIYPLNFETEKWEQLWNGLKGVFEHWIAEGVTIFRVDNPHTKSFRFWEWCIGEIKREHPEVIFLAEAFTRPRRMYGLAKMGFTQSYTYFTWRTARNELEEFITELTSGEVAEHYRPNLWPNTPDILHELLQTGGTPAFKMRFALAATLSSNYGIYGPAFELQESVPREPGSEEYLDSEKYEIRRWVVDDPRSLAPFITTINRIRRDNAALQQTGQIRFHATDTDLLIAYSKSSPGASRSGESRSGNSPSGPGNIVLVVVNLSYEHTVEGWVEFSPAAAGMPDSRPFTVTELISGESYRWDGYWNYVKLDPYDNPVQIFRLENE